jgi:hypothetical protein
LTHKYSLLIKFLVLAGCIIVIGLRDVQLISEPRLWAEEGTRYYNQAYYYSDSPYWYMGLVRIQRGYLALWPSLATTTAANLFSVEQTPLVTTLFAFVIQIIPFAIVLWSQAAFWKPAWRKIAGVLILLFAPISAEAWLNTINSQFFLALSTFLILLEEAEVGKVQTWLYRILLGVAGLTGPVSGILTPLFVFKAWKEKKRQRVIQAGLLGACAIIQLLILLISSRQDPSVGLRFAVIDLRPFPLVLITQCLGPVLVGPTLSGQIASTILPVVRSGGLPIVIAIALSLAIIGTIFWLAVKRLANIEKVIFIGSYFLLVFFGFVGSLWQDKFALIQTGDFQRYFFVPNAIFMLILLANINELKFEFHTVFFILALTTVLVLGIASYRPTTIGGPDWPKWSQEIQAWRIDPGRKINIWPLGWQITLRKQQP